MFEIKNVEVVGMRQLVEGLRQAQGLHYTDSVQTHIEDPETLETAPYQFLLGEKDSALIDDILSVNDCPIPVFDIRGFLTIYADIKAGLGWWEAVINSIGRATFSVIEDGACYRKVRLTYADVYALLKTYRDEKHLDWLLFREWAATLPYQELLLLPDRTPVNYAVPRSRF